MVANLTLVPFILFSTIIISSLTVFLVGKIHLSENIRFVFYFAVCFILIHAGYSFAVEVFVSDGIWKEWLGPFILLYGPLFFIALRCIQDVRISVRWLLLHAIPFFVYLGWAILLSWGGIFSDGRFQSTFGQVLYLTGSVSFISYAVVSLSMERKIITEKIRYNVLIIASARIMFLFLGVLMLSTVLFAFRPSPLYALKILGFCCQLALVGLIYYSLVRRLNEKAIVEPIGPGDREIDAGKGDKYEKSLLNEQQLDHYQQRLVKAVQKDRIFLEPNLSLSRLASHLKMPSHHLTQLLSRKAHQTFYEYINKLRIEYACKLLEEDPSATFERVAEQSGFNSKPSFNRQFKSLMGCSPSEYRAARR